MVTVNQRNVSSSYHGLGNGEHAARDAVEGAPRQQQACGASKRHRKPPNGHARGGEGHERLATNHVAPSTPKAHKQESEELVDGRAQAVEVDPAGIDQVRAA